MQCRLPGVEMTDVEVHMATYSLFATDHRRQAVQISIMTVFEVGKGHT